MRFNRFLAAALAAATCAPLGAQTLTLAEAQRRAVERSLVPAAQDAAIASAREMAVAAGQRPDPVLRLGIDNLPVEGPDRFSTTRDFMTMKRIGLMQEFTRADKRELRAERFEREAGRSLAEKAGRVAGVRRDTALAWIERFYAEAMAAVVAEQSKFAAQELVAAEGAYRGGRGTQAEVLAAHGSLAALEDRASELARRVRTATIGLVRWVGEEARAPLAGRPPVDVLPLDARALNEALERHPRAAVLSRQEDLARTEARLAQAGRKADWSVEVAYQQRGSLYGDMLSIGLAVPLQWSRASLQDREVAAKLAQAEQARAEREEALRAQLAEGRALIAEWESGRERLARYARDLLPLTRERTLATQAAYAGGKTGLAELLLARRNETDVRLQAVQLEMETARLWAQLDYLVPEGR